MSASSSPFSAVFAEPAGVVVVGLVGAVVVAPQPARNPTRAARLSNLIAFMRKTPSLSISGRKAGIVRGASAGPPRRQPDSLAQAARLLRRTAGQVGGAAVETARLRRVTAGAARRAARGVGLTRHTKARQGRHGCQGQTTEDLREHGIVLCLE